MPLADLALPIDETAIPREVAAFHREARRRIARFQIDHHIPGFVVSDFERAYRVLRALGGACLTPGNSLCEWGCGFGVVAGLAAMLEYDACGIEVEPELVDAAQRLADDFDLPVQIIRGSFIPRKNAARLELGNEFAWLNTERDSGLEEAGLAPADFDVIFAYPWPDEEGLIELLFEEHAAAGAVLLTYHGGEDFRLRGKRRRRASRPP